MDIIDILRNKKGFIAALDQSGGSSKKTLANYGILSSNIISDEVMFDYIHDMRKRIVTNKYFTNDHVIGVILFKDTMERKINGKYTATYLMEEKKIFSFLKIDVGLDDECDGVRLFKDIPNLEEVLSKAKEYGIIGTKMRSVINEYNEYGIKKVIEQQFSLARIIINNGLIPIIEPEVSIDAKDKKRIESFMKIEILKQLVKFNKEDYLMFKFTIPDIPNFYDELLRHKNVLRIVALSGGYTREDACQKLKQNRKMIASFSRALLESLNINQTDEEFGDALKKTILEIYDASVNKK